jgi:uncharacterized membrane protein
MSKMALEGANRNMLKVDGGLSRSLAFALISLVMLPQNEREGIKSRIQELIQAISEKEQSDEK